MFGETAQATSGRSELFVQMSKIRTEAGELLRVLAKLEKAAAPESGGGEPELATAVLRQAIADAGMALDSADPATLGEEVEKLLRGDEDLSACADDAWAATSGLSTLIRRWPRDPDADAAAVIVSARECAEILKDISFHSTKVTIRKDLERELETMHVGKALDFDYAFGSQLRDRAERTKVLSYLKHMKFGGWVDTAGGTVYKLPPGGWPRLLACIAPFLTAALAAGALYGFAAAFDVAKFGDGTELLLIFGLVLVGTVSHLGVENLKQSLTGSVPILALSDGVYWLSLRWLGLVKTVMVALMVVVGLRLGDVGPSGQGLTICLAAGYSLDSVAGIFLTRFAGTVEGGAAGLTKLLGNGGGADQGTPKPAATP